MVLAEESGEGSSDMSVAFDELSVKACEAEKPTEASGGCRGGPIHHSLNFIRIRGYTCRGDDVAQVIQLGLGEDIFGFFQVELIGGECREDRVQVRDMRRKVAAIDENVVKKHNGGGTA